VIEFFKVIEARLLLFRHQSKKRIQFFSTDR